MKVITLTVCYWPEEKLRKAVLAYDLVINKAWKKRSLVYV